jgi:hypothetical protein
VDWNSIDSCRSLIFLFDIRVERGHVESGGHRLGKFLLFSLYDTKYRAAVSLACVVAIGVGAVVLVMIYSLSFRNKSHPLENNFYVSFSFPHLAGTEIEIELRFLNNEENPISVENIGAMELFGNDNEPSLKLDECHDPAIVDVTNNEVNSSPPPGSRTQGSYVAKALQFVIYANSINIKLNGTDTRFPLEISPRRPIIVNVKFPVDTQEKNRPMVNFFVVCPSVKVFDTRGQESVSVCPGLIEMTISKEKYSADSFRVARLIATHEKHLLTVGPSPETGNVYRVFAQRAGRFQLTPQIKSSSCPLIAPD